MEKGEKMDCDSMATVNVNDAKDFESTLDYQEAPPAYSNMKASSTMIQVTKIVAVAAVTIAAMLSVALVFSAWLTSSSCQQTSLEGFLPPEQLRSILSFGAVPTGGNDLEISETKLASKKGPVDGLQKDKMKDKQDSSSSEEDDGSGEDAAVTMLKLPFEISLQEHMFERNHRSHMNCVIEKKKAEEIVDEQSKPLPALLGLNMTTDPRYLHFSGEKMAISCDSGNDHRQAPKQAPHQHRQPILPNHFNPFGQQQAPSILSRRSHYPQSSQQSQANPLSEMLTSALAAAGSSSLPIHIIGPIPLTQAEAQQFQSANTGPFQSVNSGPFQSVNSGTFQSVNSGPFQSQSPPQFSSQFQQQSPPQHFFQGPQQSREELIGIGSFGALGLPPHLIPILMPQQENQLGEDESSSRQTSGLGGPLFYPPSGSSPSQEYQGSFNTGPSSGEVMRERALPHPIPIMPRAHVQHLIRPRRSIVEEPAQAPVLAAPKRIKRCACDCACKNHPLE